MFATKLTPNMMNLFLMPETRDLVSVDRLSRDTSLFEMVFYDYLENDLETRLDGITRSVERTMLMWSAATFRRGTCSAGPTPSQAR